MSDPVDFGEARRVGVGVAGGQSPSSLSASSRTARAAGGGDQCEDPVAVTDPAAEDPGSCDAAVVATGGAVAGGGASSVSASDSRGSSGCGGAGGSGDGAAGWSEDAASAGAGAGAGAGGSSAVGGSRAPMEPDGGGADDVGPAAADAEESKDSESTPAGASPRRRWRRPPLKLDDVDLGKVRCRRVEVLAADGSACVQLRGDNRHTYQLIRTLQAALMGRVCAAVLCGPPPLFAPTDTFVAIKEMSLHCIRTGTTVDGHRCKDKPYRELRIMRYFSQPRHPHICSLLDVFEDDEYLYAVMEYLPGGDMLGHVKQAVHPGDSSPRLTEAAAKRFFVQALLAVDELHAHGLAHRDMSLENAMLDPAGAGDGVLKVIDFGLSVELPLQDDGSRSPVVSSERVGKWGYMAPEVFAQMPYSAVAADLWSLGVMLFIKLFGVPPYKYPNPKFCQAYNVIHRVGLKALLDHWQLTAKVSKDACNLVLAMLDPDLDKRLTLEQIIHHPWLAEYAHEFEP